MSRGHMEAITAAIVEYLRQHGVWSNAEVRNANSEGVITVRWLQQYVATIIVMHDTLNLREYNRSDYRTFSLSDPDALFNMAEIVAMRVDEHRCSYQSER